MEPTKRELLAKLAGRVSPEVIGAVESRLCMFGDRAHISVEIALDATKGFAEAQDVVLEDEPKTSRDVADLLDS